VVGGARMGSKWWRSQEEEAAWVISSCGGAGRHGDRGGFGERE